MGTLLRKFQVAGLLFALKQQLQKQGSTTTPTSSRCSAIPCGRWNRDGKGGQQAQDFIGAWVTKDASKLNAL